MPLLLLASHCSYRNLKDLALEHTILEYYVHAFTVYLWPRLPACADKAWRRAAVCSLVPVTYEGTVEAYKAATCHYRAHPSFSTNKIHNYTPHITLIGPTEVIANQWYCYHWFHYSYLRSSQTRQTSSQHTHIVNEKTNWGNVMIDQVTTEDFLCFLFQPTVAADVLRSNKKLSPMWLKQKAKEQLGAVAAVCQSLGQLTFPSTCFIFPCELHQPPNQTSSSKISTDHSCDVFTLCFPLRRESVEQPTVLINTVYSL